MHFRVKIWDIEQQREFILASAEAVEYPKGLRFKVKISGGQVFFITFRLVIQRDDELYEVLPESRVNSSSHMSKSAPEKASDSIPTIRISNPLFGKNMDLIRNVTIMPYAHRLFQLHENQCDYCKNHKPCTQIKFKGVNVLLDSNELWFYIRLMTPPPNSEDIVVTPLFLDPICTYDYSQQLGKEGERVAVPEDSYQLLATLEQAKIVEEIKENAHCLSTPIIVEELISPEAIGYDFEENFWQLLSAGLSVEVREKLSGLSCFKQRIRRSMQSRIMFAKGDIDAELYLFFRENLIAVDIRHLVRRSDHMGDTVLHYAAVLRFNLFLDFILQENALRGKGVANIAVVNTTDINGRTPLHFAALGGHRSTVICLLAHHAACARKDITGKTPLIYAKSIGAVGIAKLINRWAQVRETQVLISSLSLEKDKLREQVINLEAQLNEANKAKKSKKKEPTQVCANPLFGKRSPTKKMQKGKLKMEGGTPVFTPKQKSKRAERAAESRRAREHELRSSLEHQTMLKDSTLSHISQLIKTKKLKGSSSQEIKELKEIVHILKGTHGTKNKLPLSPNPSESVLTPYNIPTATQRERIRQFEREPRALALPFTLESSKRSNRKRKKRVSPVEIKNENENLDKSPLAKQVVPLLSKSNTGFTVKQPKEKRGFSKSPNTDRGRGKSKKKKMRGISEPKLSFLSPDNIMVVHSTLSTSDLMEQYKIHGAEQIDESYSTKEYLATHSQEILYTIAGNDGTISIHGCARSLIIDWIVIYNKDCSFLNTFLATYKNQFSSQKLFSSLTKNWKRKRNLILRKRYGSYYVREST